MFDLSYKKAGVTLLITLALLFGGCLADPNINIEQTPAPVTSPPTNMVVLSNVASTVETRSASITWVTSQEADSLVRYGTSSGKYLFSEGNRDYKKSHNILLTNLTPGVTYYYRIGSVTTQGVATQSKEFNFKTKFIPPPKFESFTERSNTTSAEVLFKTNVKTRASLFYGTTQESITKKVEQDEFISLHSFQIENLLPGNTYYYNVVVTDEDGLTSASDEKQFQTSPANSGEKFNVGNISLAIKGLMEHEIIQKEKVYKYSKAEITLENLGNEVEPISILSTVILDENGNQFNGVQLNEPDEFISADIFPRGKLKRAMYYEEVSENGTLYLHIQSDQEIFKIKVNLKAPPTNKSTVKIDVETPEETQKSIRVELQDFDPRFEILTSKRSNLYARIDVLINNTGDLPVVIKLNPVPGLIDDKGEQHLYAKTGHEDELPLGTLHPGGTIKGAIFFAPEISHTSNFAQLIIYVNNVKYDFILNPSKSF